MRCGSTKFLMSSDFRQS